MGGDPRGDVLTAGALTRTGAALFAYADRVGARLLVIDPTGIAVAVPEIDRAAVSMALAELRERAKAAACSVLLVRHPAKASEGEAADYSGSTAWRGSVRTLLTLRTPPPKGDGAVDHDCEQWRTMTGGGERVARLARLNNYGPSDGALTLATRGKAAGWCLVDPLPPPSGAAACSSTVQGADSCLSGG
ncbi:MAG: AAA family ATPase [Spirochaetaceae bacterium]|nr:AAA family ATPase [Spirochaetaceae bacterium]